MFKVYIGCHKFWLQFNTIYLNKCKRLFLDKIVSTVFPCDLCFTFLSETLLYQKETILFFLHKFNDQLCQCIPTFSEYEILKQQIGQKNFAANFTKKNLAASQKIFFLPMGVPQNRGRRPRSPDPP